MFGSLRMRGGNNEKLSADVVKDLLRKQNAEPDYNATIVYSNVQNIH